MVCPARAPLSEILMCTMSGLFPTGNDRKGVEDIVKESPRRISSISGLHAFLHTEEGNADPFLGCFPLFDGEDDVVSGDGIVESRSDHIEVEVVVDNQVFIAVVEGDTCCGKTAIQRRGVTRASTDY